MAQENANRLHAYINLVPDGLGDTRIAASGGIDLASIVREADDFFTLRLTAGLSDEECFYAIGTNEALGVPSIIAVTRIPDLAQNFFRLQFTGAGPVAAGSVSWWSVPIQGAAALPPPP